MSSAWAFLALAVIVVGAVYMVYRAGRKAERKEVLEVIADVKEKQLEAANQPRDRGATTGKLRDGKF